MRKTSSARRLSSSLLSLASMGAVFLLAGCASVYNNAVGITAVPAVVQWNTNGPLPPLTNNDPTIQPAQPATTGAILTTTPLGAGELNAIIFTPGTTVYSPAEGTFLSPGLQTLSLTFTPTDTTHYKVTKFSVQIQVNDPTSAAGLASLVPQSVQIIGGGYVPNVLFHPAQNGLRYARTDVGGAYRWDPKPLPPDPTDPTKTIKAPTGIDNEPLPYGVWTPLLDFVGRANGGDQGVESIGLDPNDAKRLYLATGLNYNNDPNQQNHFYLSDDQGNTFTQVNAPFPINGNDNGRDAGERFAVDPNLGTTLYYGSRTAGMWRSLDRGLTWSQVISFPVTGITKGAGVVWITFVPGSGVAGTATPVLYAGVSDYNYYNSDGSNNGTPTYAPVYISVDAGATWQAVTGEPTSVANPNGKVPATYNLSPVHGLIGLDGRTSTSTSLYVTYLSEQGPGLKDAGAGAVYQYAPVLDSPSAAGTWTNLSSNIPRNGDSGGYGGLTFDAKRPGVIMVGTMDDYAKGEAIYRSQDYGKSWVVFDQGTSAAQNDPINSQWLAFSPNPATVVGTGNWISALAIDPFDSTHAEWGSGQTLWDGSGPSSGIETADSGGTPVFSPGAYGAAAGGVKQVPGGQSIEETVVLGLTAPITGAPLFSAVGDLGTFVHLSLDQSPVLGASNAPQFTTGTGVDFAQEKALTLVRVGTGGTQLDTNAPYYPDPTKNPPDCIGPNQAKCLQVKIPQLLAVTRTQGARATDWTPGDTLYDAPDLKSVGPNTKMSVGGGTVAISADASTIVWATYDFPPACSANSGTAWTPAVNGIIGAQVISDRVTPGKYYMYDSASGKLLMGVATVASASASTGFACNLTFNTMATLPAYSYGQLTASFAADGDVWLAINGSSSSDANGIYHSTDSGKTLTKQGSFTAAYAVGLGAPATSSAVPTYSQPAAYIVADGPSGYGFYRSVDNGATWTPVSNPSHLLGTVNQIVGDQRTFGRFYIGTSGRGIAYVDSQ